MDIEEAKKIIKEISKVYKSNAVLQVYDDISRDESIENYKAIETVLAELNKQEKIINAMSEYIFLAAGQTIFKNKEELKQYYEKKVSEE